MAASAGEETNSVVVRNVAPTVDPPTHKVLADFFSFCGNITALSIAPDDRDSTGQAVMAIVTFESKAAARTAVLLNNALINERAIQVELAPIGFSLSSNAASPQIAVHSVPSSDLPQRHTTDDRTQTSVIVSLLAKGYILQKDALNKAREFDEEHSISKKAAELAEQAAQGIREVDAKLGVSATLKTWGDTIQTKAVELGQQYQVNEKTQAASQALGDFGRSVSQTLNEAAQTTQEFVQSTPVLQNATQTISGWGAAIAGAFRDAKLLAEGQQPQGQNEAQPQDPLATNNPDSVPVVSSSNSEPVKQ